MKLDNLIYPFVTGLLLLSTGLSPCFALDADWQEQMNFGVQKLSESSFSQAEKLLLQAYEQVKKLPADDSKRLNNEIALGDLYRGMKKTQEAERFYKQALATLENSRSPMAQAMVLNKLAGLYKDQSKFGDAEALYKRALSLAENERGQKDLTLVRTLANMSVLYQEGGRLNEAEETQARVVRILGRKPDSDSKDYAQALYDLASLELIQKKSDIAVAHYKEALAILEPDLPVDDLRIACCLEGLGTAYFAEKHYAEAEALSRRALGIYEQKLGKDNEEVAIALSNLGHRLLSQNKLDEARASFQRSWQIQSKKFGYEAFELIPNLQGLAEVYARKPDYKKCETLLRLILSIKRKKYGENHAALISSYINIGNCLNRQGTNSPEAAGMLKQAQSMRDSIPRDRKKQAEGLIESELIPELTTAAKPNPWKREKV
ncbi:MAG: tetratricopeptide repeat protein [Candidatus Obscuribacterales bacterium]|nr:tetratricopeptide repeat protein [Candidatus Obscuribacterales bacterium]